MAKFVVQKAGALGDETVTADYYRHSRRAAGWKY